MPETIIVVRASRYEFVGNNGEQVAGVNVTYTYGDLDNREDSLGLVQYDDNLPLSAWRELERGVPGVFEVEEEQRALRDAKGKNRRVTKVVGLRFLGRVQLAPVVPAGNGQPVEMVG